MANAEHLAILRKGVASWNRWRKSNPHIHPWLAKADLSGLTLTQINFSRTCLREVKLCAATLNQADLRDAELEGVDATGLSARGADFSRANLRQIKLPNANLADAVFTSAQFRKAKLSGAVFRKAYLSGTKISRCSVHLTDFTRAQLYEASFIDLDLSETIGLGSCDHHGPSVVDRRTIMRSGSLPQNFLRGCGINDWEITAAELYRSDLSAKEIIDIGYHLIERRTTDPVQHFSCFISYSHQDGAFARKLHGALQEIGIRCWLDEKQMRPGDDIFERIDEGLRLWDKVLLCCSADSLTSWWCDKELGIAFEKEEHLSKRRAKPVRTIIPLDLDGYMFSDSWKSGYRAEVRRRLAVNFTTWKEETDTFSTRVRQVVRALRVDDFETIPPPKSLL